MLTNGASLFHIVLSIKECLGSIVRRLLQSYFKEAGNKHGVRVKHETQNRENETTGNQAQANPPSQGPSKLTFVPQPPRLETC